MFINKKQKPRNLIQMLEQHSTQSKLNHSNVRTKPNDNYQTMQRDTPLRSTYFNFLECIELSRMV